MKTTIIFDTGFLTDPIDRETVEEAPGFELAWQLRRVANECQRSGGLPATQPIRVVDGDSEKIGTITTGKSDQDTKADGPRSMRTTIVFDTALLSDPCERERQEEAPGFALAEQLLAIARECDENDGALPATRPLTWTHDEAVTIGSVTTQVEATDDMLTFATVSGDADTLRQAGVITNTVATLLARTDLSPFERDGLRAMLRTVSVMLEDRADFVEGLS